jgi:hypothetical protein
MIALLFTVLLIIAAISDVWIHRTTSHRCVKIIKTARAIWRSWPGVLWIGIVIPWLCIIIPTMLFAAAVEWVTDNICSPAMAAVETFKHWLHGFDYYEARRRRNVERRRANRCVKSKSSVTAPNAATAATFLTIAPQHASMVDTILNQKGWLTARSKLRQGLLPAVLPST